MFNYLKMHETAKRMSHPARVLVSSLAKERQFELGWLAPRGGFKSVDDWNETHIMLRYLEKKLNK